MNQNNWIDRLDDEEIYRLIVKKPKYKKISYFTDNKLLKIILDKEKINRERKEITFIKFTRRALLFSFIIICLLFFNIIFFKNFYKLTYNRCFVTKKEGNAYIQNKTGKIKNIEKIPYRVKRLESIITEKNSEINLNIGIYSKIQLNESSELKITKIYGKKDIEKTNLFIKSGNINFNPKLLSNNSKFQVETDLIIINVTGTYFIVNVDKYKNTIVFVRKGSVLIKPKINQNDIEKIKKIDHEFANKIKNILSVELKLNKDENIEILYSEFKDIESRILNIINSIYIKLSQNKGSKIKIREIIEQSKDNLDELIKLRNKLLQMFEEKLYFLSNKESKKDKFVIKKLDSSITLNLTEKNTYINTSNNFLYISSDSNNSIYSINTLNGIIKWKFNNPDIKDITSAIVPFKDKLILCASNSIYILDKNGNLILKKRIGLGVTFWAKSIIIHDKLFIPTNKYIYIYDGKNINKLENFPESSGQLYISCSTNKLFLFDSNQLIIKIFDLKINKVIWTSSPLKERAFIEPHVIKNNIYITDIKNNLYKFDYLKSNIPKIINIGSGSLTNIVSFNNKEYFIGINGYFYELNNDSIKKIIKVDKHPEMNKYLTKKIILYNDLILFCSDTGSIFYYDIKNNKTDLLEVSQNKKKLPLIGTPVIINNDIYFVDTESNIYRMSINL